MIDIETLTRLKMMRLSGMAEYFENLATTTDAATVSGPELVKQAVDWEYERRRDAKLHRLRRHAGLAQPGADIADLKAMPGRAMDTELIARLAIGSYLAKRQDVILQGPTGAGKTYLACAAQDELYVVQRGTSDFWRDGSAVAVQAGDILFVPAGVAHRFENFSPDFVTWVVFYGPSAGEKP